MKHDYFLSLENVEDNTEVDINEVLDQLAFNSDGLIPVITQDVWVKKFREHELANPTLALSHGYTLKIPDAGRQDSKYPFIHWISKVLLPM